MNKEQLKVIENHTGAMQVNAVAGSGKTTMLIHRIANMLGSDEQIHPENLLALTFTEAAATTMRRKLIEFIGQDAYRINIFTFHGFANDIIQSNPNYFAMRETEPVSEIEQVEILKKIVDELPMNHPLKRYKGDAYYEIYRMKKLFLDMKMEDWSASFLENMANQYINDLHYDERYIYKRANKKKGIKKGDIKEAALSKERERMVQLTAAAKLIGKYNRELERRSRIDFSDMISLVIKAFKADDNFLRTYQEHYQYIMVDEMQDTNGSQFAILDMLLSFWPDPNVFIVGDINQSIYGFQGANIMNIDKFNKKYDPEIVFTNKNYRSTQEILDAATNVIKNNRTFTKSLLSGRDSHGEIPKVLQFDTTIQEQAFILNEIERLHESGVAYGDIAVLYRKHDQATDLIDACQRKGIEVNVKRRFNTLDHPLVRQIITILDHAVNVKEVDSSSPLVSDILCYGFLEKKPVDIVAFAAKDEVSDDIREVLDYLTMLAVKVHNDPPLKVIEEIVESRVIQQMITEDDRAQSVVVLSSFYKWVKNEIFRNPTLDTADLLKRIENMRDNKISVPVIDLVAAHKGITFSTMHGAKGLEWKHVYMIGLSRDKWESNRGNTNKYKLPETITYYEDKEDKVQSERRLFYVGMTRAEEHLTMTYAVQDESRELTRSMFVNETLLDPETVEQVSIPSYLSTLMQPFVPLKLTEQRYVKEILEHLRLSVSAVNKYLECPVSFFFENILRMPFVANAALVFGNSFHETAKWMYDLSRKLDDIPTLNETMEYFEHRMSRNRGQLNRMDFVRRLELGKQLLPQWYEQVFMPSNKVTVNEYVMKSNIEGVPVKYIFDKIEFDGYKAGIVDYKSGNSKYMSNHLKPVSGDYWRQMVVGKMLIDKHDKWQFNGARIDMFDEGFSSFPVDVTEKDEKVVTEQFREVYDHIKNADFSEGCGECKWCKMMKEIKI